MRPFAIFLLLFCFLTPAWAELPDRDADIPENELAALRVWWILSQKTNPKAEPYNYEWTCTGTTIRDFANWKKRIGGYVGRPFKLDVKRNRFIVYYHNRKKVDVLEILVDERTKEVISFRLVRTDQYDASSDVPSESSPEIIPKVASKRRSPDHIFEDSLNNIGRVLADDPPPALFAALAMRNVRRMIGQGLKLKGVPYAATQYETRPNQGIIAIETSVSADNCYSYEFPIRKTRAGWQAEIRKDLLIKADRGSMAVTQVALFYQNEAPVIPPPTDAARARKLFELMLTEPNRVKPLFAVDRFYQSKINSFYLFTTYTTHERASWKPVHLGLVKIPEANSEILAIQYQSADHPGREHCAFVQFYGNPARIGDWMFTFDTARFQDPPDPRANWHRAVLRLATVPVTTSAQTPLQASWTSLPEIQDSVLGQRITLLLNLARFGDRDAVLGYCTNRVARADQLVWWQAEQANFAQLYLSRVEVKEEQDRVVVRYPAGSSYRYLSLPTDAKPLVFSITTGPQASR